MSRDLSRDYHFLSVMGLTSVRTIRIFVVASFAHKAIGAHTTRHRVVTDRIVKAAAAIQAINGTQIGSAFGAPQIQFIAKRIWFIVVVVVVRCRWRPTVASGCNGRSCSNIQRVGAVARRRRWWIGWIGWCDYNKRLCRINGDCWGTESSYNVVSTAEATVFSFVIV